jgi:hypothetical protein
MREKAKVRYISKDRRFLWLEPLNGPKQKIYAHRKSCRVNFDLIEIGHEVFYRLGTFKGRSLACDIDFLPESILPSEIVNESAAEAAATFVPFKPARDCAQAPSAGIPVCALKILAEPDARSL